MSSERVTLLSIRCEGSQWLAEASFRNVQRTMTFEPDEKDQLHEVSGNELTLTLEGREIGHLVDRARHGEDLSLPHTVEPLAHGPRLPSACSEPWRTEPGPLDVWLSAVEHVGDATLVAHLLIDGEPDLYEIEVLLGPVLRVVRSPQSSAFHSFVYDVDGMLLRMHRGERFSLPFKLRPRWPTPDAPPALPPDE